MNNEPNKDEIDFMANLLKDTFGTEEHGWDKKEMICVDVRQLAEFVNNYRRDAVGWENAYFDLRKVYQHTDKAYESNRKLAEDLVQEKDSIRITPERLYPYSIVSNGKVLALYDPCVEGDAFYQEFEDMKAIVSWLEEHRPSPHC